MYEKRDYSLGYLSRGAVHTGAGLCASIPDERAIEVEDERDPSVWQFQSRQAPNPVGLAG